MAEGSKALLGLLLAAGAGVGAYWYFARTKDCNQSIFGGVTGEAECFLKNILQIGCEWDGVTCTSTGGGGGSTPLDYPCNYPGQYQCFSDPPTEGNDAYKCQSNPFSSTGYAYALKQKSHPSCPGDMHRACFPYIDNDGVVTGLNYCKTTIADEHTCYNSGPLFHYGCECDDSCETDIVPGYCCPDYRCQWVPIGQKLTLNRSDFTECVTYPAPLELDICSWDILQNPKSPIIYPMAAQTLTNAVIHWTNGPVLPTLIGYRIEFVYQGNVFVFDENDWIWISTTEGDLNIPLVQHGGRHCAEKINIGIWGASGIKIGYFIGYWS